MPSGPAPGFRGYDHGKVRGSGYSWALTVASSSVRFLGFGYGFLARMVGKTPGGRGFQLRCLQEKGGGPAPGFRDSGAREETEGGSGKLYHVGHRGYICSSSIAGINAHSLGFDPDWLGSQSYNNRSYGFQLRCLQE